MLSEQATTARGEQRATHRQLLAPKLLNGM